MRPSGFFAALSLVLAASVGCRSSGRSASREPSPRASSGAASVPSPLAIPSSTAERPEELEDAAQIVVSKHSMLVDGELVASLPETREAAARTGMDAKYKPTASSRYVTPLGDAVKEHLRRASADGGSASTHAMVLVDPTTPYRVLAEVLFTLGQCGVAKFHLLQLQGKQTADAGLAAPTPSPSARAPLAPPSAAPRKTPLMLRVELSEEGASFRTTDGVLGPRCDRASTGLTVPKIGATQDEEGIRLCARRLKTEAPEESSVAIGAGEGVDFASLLIAMDGLRKDERGELFSDVLFTPPP